MSNQVFRVTKDPDAVLDYSLDWSEWLMVGDSLAVSSWLAEAGITIDSYARDGNVTTVWLSGGQAGRPYIVTNRVVTGGGREDDRSIVVYVTER